MSDDSGRVILPRNIRLWHLLAGVFAVLGSVAGGAVWANTIEGRLARLEIHAKRDAAAWEKVRKFNCKLCHEFFSKASCKDICETGEPLERKQ